MMQKKRLLTPLLISCVLLTSCRTTSEPVDAEAETAAEATAVESDSNYFTPNVDVGSYPDNVTVYDKMRFTTTIPATDGQAAYQYVEEVNGETNNYSYQCIRNYSEIREYFSLDGAFVYLRMGDMECSLRAPSFNISTLNTIVDDINTYVTAIQNATYYGSNVDYWIYHTTSDGSIPYTVYVEKGEEASSYIVRMSSSIFSLAKEVNQTKTEMITKLTYTTDAGSFPDCINVTNAQIELILKAFNNDATSIKTADAISQFELERESAKQTLLDYYMTYITPEEPSAAE